MIGDRDTLTGEVVVPVHPEEVPGVGSVLVRVPHGPCRDGGRVGELPEGGQHHALFAEPGDGAGPTLGVDDRAGESELSSEHLGIERVRSHW